MKFERAAVRAARKCALVALVAGGLVPLAGAAPAQAATGCTSEAPPSVLQDGCDDDNPPETSVTSSLTPNANGLVTSSTVTFTLGSSVDDGDLGLPNNLDNDLWQEFWQEEGAISLPMDLPLGTSVAVIGDGVEAAPSDVRVVWPNAATYPLFGPFMTAGFVLLAFSLLFLAIGLSNHRRKRGPQRATAKAISRRERRAIAKGKAPVVMASRQEQLTEAPVAEAVADNDQSSAATQTEPENETDSADKGQAEEPEGEDRA